MSCFKVGQTVMLKDGRTGVIDELLPRAPFKKAVAWIRINDGRTVTAIFVRDLRHIVGEPRRRKR